MHPQNCYQVNGTYTPRKPFALVDKACIAHKNMHKSTKTKEYLFYKTCFPTIQHFVQSLLPPTGSNTENNDNNIDNKCHRLAWNILRGEGGPNGMAGHLFCGYQYYAALTTKSYPNTRILIARTEYLWHDLENMDRQLGGTGAAFANQWMEQQGAAATTEMPYHKDKLSPLGYQILCCAIQREIAMYWQWLQAATNLLPEDKDESFLQVLDKCSSDGDYGGYTTPIQSLEELDRHCQSVLPLPLPERTATKKYR
jgi:hypothetical protein